MDQQSATIAGVAGVGADLAYLAPMTERPHGCTYDPPPGVPRTTANAPHRMAVHGFYDDIERRRVRYLEAQRLVAAATGAARAIAFHLA